MALAFCLLKLIICSWRASSFQPFCGLLRFAICLAREHRRVLIHATRHPCRLPPVIAFWNAPPDLILMSETPSRWLILAVVVARVDFVDPIVERTASIRHLIYGPRVRRKFRDEIVTNVARVGKSAAVAIDLGPVAKD